jgi:hypothetical protein
MTMLLVIAPALFVAAFYALEVVLAWWESR